MFHFPDIECGLQEAILFWEQKPSLLFLQHSWKTAVRLLGVFCLYFREPWKTLHGTAERNNTDWAQGGLGSAAIEE